jgi:hypothetical protein
VRHLKTPHLPMLICHCNIITSREIEEIIRGFLRDDPWAIIVPAKVYRELDKRCKCSGCVPNVVDLITRVTDEYHREIAELPAAETPPPAAAPERRKRGSSNERRSTGHRAA